MIVPSGHPLIAMTIITLKSVKDSLIRVESLGLSTKDTIALEDANDVLHVFAEGVRDILPDMLHVVYSIDHKRDPSAGIKAKPHIERLRALCRKYEPAFKVDRLPRFSIAKLFPTSLTGLVGAADLEWRTLLGIIEDAVRDEKQMDMIDKFRGLLIKGIPFIDACLFQSLIEVPDLEKVKVIRRIEDEWIVMVRNGRDKHQAYKDLETRYSEHDSKLLKEMMAKIGAKPNDTPPTGGKSTEELFRDLDLPSILGPLLGHDSEDEDGD